MTLSGERANQFETIYTMVETCNGYFDHSKQNGDLIFTFMTADDKWDCKDIIGSLNFHNVKIENVDGLHLQISMG